MSVTREYTVWCDDRRYCNGEHLQIATNTMKDARKYARAAGWYCRYGVADQCPACYHQRRLT